MKHVKKHFCSSSITAIALSTLLLIGCAGESENPEANQSVEDNFNFTAMMANYADNIIIPSYQRFNDELTSATAENNLLQNYCTAIGTVDEPSAKINAQAQWRELMGIWQKAELFILGPAAENSNAKRNAIFSYASNFPPSSCAVDQSVVLAQDATFDITSRAFNSRGLDALEYLLFNTNLDHTCPVQITQTQNWNERTDTDRKQARCAFAQDVLADIRIQSASLLDSWLITDGDFRTQFVNPTNVNDSLKALSDALFYIELETKDDKLGLPTGIHNDCPDVACPAGIESPFSENSFENIRNNLLGFQTMLNGGDGLGFDDIIIDQGFSQVANQFNADIDTAIAFIDTIDTSLLQQSQAQLASASDAACANSAANPDSIQTVPMCSLHGLLKRISDALRVDFVTIVNLDLPDRGQSDSD